jgi:hypothetical protein
MTFIVRFDGMGMGVGIGIKATGVRGRRPEVRGQGSEARLLSSVF